MRKGGPGNMFGFRSSLSLNQRLLALVAVAAIPALAGLVYFILDIHSERAREVRDQALRASQITSLEVERIVSGATGILQAVALSADVSDGDTSRCVAYLDGLASRLPQFRGFDVIAPSGNVVCGSTGLRLSQTEVLAASWFRDARATGDLAVGVYSGAQPGEIGYLPLALPVARNGRQTMIVVVAIDLQWLAERLGERLPSAGSAVIIADRNGIVLARQPGNDQFVGQPLNEPFPKLLRMGAPGVIETSSGFDNVERIVGFQPPAASGSGLYISSGISTKTAFEPIYASTWGSVTIAALGVVLACGIVWALGDRLLRRPLLRILSTVESWRSGDLAARTGIERDGSEIASLAAATDEYMEAVLDDRNARKLAEERRSLLLREMNHRIKNLLATVQAIANQTFREGSGPDALRKFGQRLAAMAATHDLLVSSNWERTGLHATVQAALHPFGDEAEGRFVVHGPSVQITARAAFALSMALHELCTNALKYGALSQPSGGVRVIWSIGADRRFHLTWEEHGGPPCSPPGRTGFGTRLVRAAFSSDFDARASLEYPLSGLRFELDADADQLLARPAVPAAG